MKHSLDHYADFKNKDKNFWAELKEEFLAEASDSLADFFKVRGMADKGQYPYDYCYKRSLDWRKEKKDRQELMKQELRKTERELVEEKGREINLSIQNLLIVRRNILNAIHAKITHNTVVEDGKIVNNRLKGSELDLMYKIIEYEITKAEQRVMDTGTNETRILIDAPWITSPSTVRGGNSKVITPSPVEQEEKQKQALANIFTEMGENGVRIIEGEVKDPPRDTVIPLKGEEPPEPPKDENLVKTLEKAGIRVKDFLKK